MAGVYCDKQFFGKVGDKTGFSLDSILITDENSQLKLKPCVELDVHSGFSCVDEDVSIEIKKGKQSTTHGSFTQRGFVKQTGFHRFLNL